MGSGLKHLTFVSDCATAALYLVARRELRRAPNEGIPRAFRNADRFSTFKIFRRPGALRRRVAPCQSRISSAGDPPVTHFRYVSVRRVADFQKLSSLLDKTLQFAGESEDERNPDAQRPTSNSESFETRSAPALARCYSRSFTLSTCTASCSRQLP